MTDDLAPRPAGPGWLDITVIANGDGKRSLVIGDGNADSTVHRILTRQADTDPDPDGND